MYVCYFRLYNITLFQVALLAVVFEATIILFELPTGILADKYGRKLSTSIGFCLLAVSGIIFFSMKSFFGFLVAEIVFGLAETFISGALEALTVDSLAPEKRDLLLPRLFANRTVYKTVALLVGMIFAGVLGQFFLKILFLPVIFVALIGFVLTLFLIDSRNYGSNNINSEIKADKPSLPKIIFSNRAILALFGVGLLANFAYEPADQFWQVLFSEDRQVPLFYFGLITGGGFIIVAAMAKFTEKLYKHLAQYIISGFLLTGLALYIVAEFGLYPAIAGIIIYFILKELIRPAISTHLNILFNSENRATYLSGFNLTCSIGEVAAGLTAGVLVAEFGLEFIFYFAAAAAILVPIVFLLIYSKAGSL